MSHRQRKHLGWCVLLCFAVSLWLALKQNAVYGIRDAEDPVLSWRTPLWLGFYHFYVLGREFQYGHAASLFLMTGLVASAIWVTLALRAARTARPGTPMCETCSYNLTGNASGVCPECGAAVRSQDRREAHAENAGCAEGDP